MSGRRQLERRMRREGKAILGEMVPTAEVRGDAMNMVAELLPIVLGRPPIAPLVSLLALEVAKRHVELFVDESFLSPEDRARFWAGVDDELKAYDDAIKARRS